MGAPQFENRISAVPQKKVMKTVLEDDLSMIDDGDLAKYTFFAPVGYIGRLINITVQFNPIPSMAAGYRYITIDNNIEPGVGTGVMTGRTDQHAKEFMLNKGVFRYSDSITNFTGIIQMPSDAGALNDKLSNVYFDDDTGFDVVMSHSGSGIFAAAPYRQIIMFAELEAIDK